MSIMKARIRRELRVGTRFDDDLGPAIVTAIAAYRHVRWPWSESRGECVFSTQANKEFYNATHPGAEALARLKSIDYVSSLSGTIPFMLRSESPEEAERYGMATAFGQPSRYTRYQQQLRLYPIPGGVYTIRVAGVFSVAAPATELEANNPWMTSAERLIRCRAKLEIAQHRMRDLQLAADMRDEVADALSDLKSETTSQLEMGRIVPFV